MGNFKLYTKLYLNRTVVGIIYKKYWFGLKFLKIPTNLLTKEKRCVCYYNLFRRLYYYEL